MKKFLLLLTVLFSCSSVRATIYVNGETGQDNAPGTRQRPVKTLRRAVKLMRQNQDFSLDMAKTSQPYFESLVLSKMTPPVGQRLYVNGHGAILSGLRLQKSWQKQGQVYFAPGRYNRHVKYHAVLNSKVLPVARNVKDLKPLSVAWSKTGVYFCPEPGKTVDDYQIYTTTLASGVRVIDTSYATIENLKCEFFANDGFNVHGSCYDLHFRNIEGAWNSDDGFSVHEDVGVNVTDGVFHHNNFGIQDVNIARSQYHRVKVYDNFGHGVHLLGGYHAMIDSEIFNNARYQVLVQSYTAAHMKIPADNHLLDGEAYLVNCQIHGAKVGIAVKERGQLTLRKCRGDAVSKLGKEVKNITIVK